MSITREQLPAIAQCDTRHGDLPWYQREADGSPHALAALKHAAQGHADATGHAVAVFLVTKLTFAPAAKEAAAA